MGAKQSSPPRMRTSYPSGGARGSVAMAGADFGDYLGGPSTSSSGINHRNRARSLGSVPSSHNGHGITIPGNVTHSGRSGHLEGHSDSSTPEDPPASHIRNPFNMRGLAHSLPVHLITLSGLKCPVCSKFVQPDDIECHLVVCLTKPRISYNEDILTEDKGECVICFEELKEGETIARLPCLCIYHKTCIDQWFAVNRSCPEHPID